MEEFDVAVVGLGALGSAAAYHAAVKDAKVIGFEQFEFGHVKGASHDTSRIFRTSNPLPEQVALAKSAHKDWNDLERACGQELLTVTGGLVLFPRDGPHSAGDFTSSLDAHGLPYKILSSKKVNERWPRFKVPENVDAVFTEDTGVLHAAKSTMAMQFMARFHGATLKEKTSVTRIEPIINGNGVIVHTTQGSFRAAKVILATDAWTNELLEPLGAQVHLTVMQEQVTYFKPNDISGFEPQNFPVWIWGAEKWFYGFPSYGEPTIKVARDTSGNYMTPDKRTFEPSQKLLEELKDFTQSIIPTKGQTMRTVTCQYTITQDRQLIMSPLQNYPDIILGLGAAIGFKYAPAIGRVLAELAVDGESTEDVTKFGIPKPVSSSKL